MSVGKKMVFKTSVAQDNPFHGEVHNSLDIVSSLDAESNRVVLPKHGVHADIHFQCVIALAHVSATSM